MVGVVRSPFYISLERGTSTLGTGQATAFLCLPESAFAMDYYTAAYLTVQGAAEEVAFSDAYQAIVDASVAELEQLAEVRAPLRRQAIVDEANEKLADAQRQLDDARAEAEEKLSDAWGKLQDARRQLDDGWRDYRDGQKTLTEETAKARQQLSDAEQELADALAALNENEAAYAEGLAQWQDGKRQYEEALAEFREASRPVWDAFEERYGGELVARLSGGEG